MKTSSLTTTLLNHLTPSQTVTGCTPTTHSSSSTASSGSELETVSSISHGSSRQTTINTLAQNGHDQTDSIEPEDSSEALVNTIDKLKRELVALKQAKTQLKTLYKVSVHESIDSNSFFIRHQVSISSCVYMSLDVPSQNNFVFLLPK